MGRVMGFEPTYTGTTIRGLDRLAIPAIFFLRVTSQDDGRYSSQDKIDAQVLFLKTFEHWMCAEVSMLIS